ncbi:MAG: hypothetical protein J6B60_06245 [Clostridia bacterium]|nr:hypothetical protein [Clostridia bacterium]
MTVNDHEKYTAFGSDFISITFEKSSSRLAFLGIESGGRDRDKHATYNLLKPSFGAIGGAFKKSAPIKELIKKTDSSLHFENELGACSDIDIIDDRSFYWSFKNAPKNDILNISFCIKTAPLSVWSSSVAKMNAPKHLKSSNPLVMYKCRYELPIILHFPDFGRLKIEADDGVFCEEELCRSSEFSGLGLGYLNYEYHNDLNAIHYGSSNIKFKSKNEAPSVKLKFTVLDELYPPLPFEDNDCHAWDGLRRTFMNSFSLNRERFDMGDNIMLHGTAHLCVSLKSDILQVMNGDDEHFKMARKVFERQMYESFTLAQADDGEVNFQYCHKKKGDEPMCEFIDSTPGSIIAAAGISHWNLPFAKKLLPYAMKAADFILSLDTDDDGIFEVPFSGDYMDAPIEKGARQRNWWDNFAFGHKDIYFNYLCHRALRELSQLLIKIHRYEDAKKYKAQLEKFDKSFFKTFYNPKTKVMAGWISRDGSIHDYMFTFAVSMGINEGLIPVREGKKMIKLLLNKMAEQGYGDLKFGIPGNVVPVAQRDTIDWPCMSDWGRYENGGLCGMNGFHFLTAMYKVGMEKEADKIFKAILNTYEKEFTHSGLMPGYVQSIDWRTKEGVACGYNYLADNYYFLLAAYTGKGKIKHPAVVNRS